MQSLLTGFAAEHIADGRLFAIAFAALACCIASGEHNLVPCSPRAFDCGSTNALASASNEKTKWSHELSQEKC